MSVYDVLLDQLENASARVAGKTAVFYSGSDSNGNANVDSATECVEKYKGAYYTLDDTQAGNVLRRAGVALAEDGITVDQFRSLVTIASRKFSLEASGNVIAFVEGNVAESSYFVQAELSPLLANGKVSSINGIKMSQLLSQQQSLTNLGLVALMGDEADCFPPSGPPPTATAPVTPPETGPAIQEPQPDKGTNWLKVGAGAALIVLGVVGAFTGVDEGVGAVAGVVALAARLRTLLALTAAGTATGAAAGPLLEQALPVEQRSDAAAIGLGAVDLEIGVANGDVDSTLLNQFSADQLSLAGLETALGSSQGSVSGTISDGHGGTIQVIVQQGANGAIDLQLRGPSGVLAANIINAGTSSAAVVYKSNDGKEEGAFLVDTSSQQDSSFIRKGQNGEITFGFVDGRQITLSTDGEYSFDPGDGRSITISGGSISTGTLSAANQSALVGFLSDFGTSLSQHFTIGIPAGISDLLQSSNGSYTLIGPDGNDVVFGRSNNASLVVSSPTGDAELLFGGNGQNVTVGSENTALIAVGNDNILNTDQSGQKIVSIGQGTVVNGQSAGASGTDVLAAIDNGVAATTLDAGAGNDIMIGNGVSTTFDVNANANPNGVDVIWANGGDDTFNVYGSYSYVYEINAPDATLQSVANLDVASLAAAVAAETGFGPNGSSASIIVINAQPGEQLNLGGQLIGDASYSSVYSVVDDDSGFTTYGFVGTSGVEYDVDNVSEFSPLNLNALGVFVGTQPAYNFVDIVGFVNGDFGITISGDGPNVTAYPNGDINADVVSPNFYSAITPTFDLQQYQASPSDNRNAAVTSAANQTEVSGAGVGLEISSNTASSSVTDVATLVASNASDTLVTITSAAAYGSADTLIAGGAADTLASFGSANTLVGNAQGGTLDGSAGTGTVAAYNLYGVSVDIGAGSADVAGSQQADTLIGIGAAEAFGYDDTLIAGDGTNTLLAKGYADTLIGNGSGSRLDATGGSSTVAAYTGDNITIDLTTGTASVNGSSVSDTLVGIVVLDAYGSHDSVIGGSAAASQATLAALGTAGTLIGGSGTTTLTSDLAGNTLVASTGLAIAYYTAADLIIDLGAGTAAVAGAGPGDTLVGITDLIVSGTDAVARAASGNNTLSALGVSETLIGRSGQDTLYAGGTNNTLIGGTGEALLTSGGLSDILIGGAGTDTLLSIGQYNTLVATNATDTLVSGGTNDLLFGGADGDTLIGLDAGSGMMAAYAIDNVTVDLGAGTASVNGSGVADTLLGIFGAAALGSDDTLIGGSSSGTLVSNGSGNTLIAGSGGATADYRLDNVTVDLVSGTGAVNSSGISDTLVGIGSATVSGNHDLVIGGSFDGTLSASGTDDTLIAAGGSGTLYASGTNDTLFGSTAGNVILGNGGSIAAYAMDDVVVNLAAGSATLNGANVGDIIGGIDRAAAYGSNDTLIGGYGSTLSSNGSGNTLIAGRYGPTVASYVLDNIVVDLTVGTANVNGASMRDTLVGIAAASISGHNDTLVSNGTGNTLIAGSGSAVAYYAVDDLALDLGTGSAAVNGSVTSDTLDGFVNGMVFGNNDTLLAGVPNGKLIAGGVGDTLVGDVGGDTLLAGTTAAAVMALYSVGGVVINLANGIASSAGSTANDTLIGITIAAVAGSADILIAGAGADTLSSFGTGDTLIAGGGADTLLSTGVANTLIAGSGSDTLVSMGVDDVLFGNAAGSILDGSAGIGVQAAYALDNVTVDLAADTAAVNGASVSDGLVGITTVRATGSSDTLIGDGGSDSLSSSGSSNTLIGGDGTAYLSSSGTGDTLLASGSSDVLSSTGQANTLIGGAGTDTLTSAGAGDVLVAGSGADILSSSGFFNTLIGGAGADSLSSGGTDDTLIAGAGDDLLESSGVGNLLIGGDGADTLFSSGSGDTLLAAMGSYLLSSTGIGNTLVADSGQDTLVSTGTGDLLFGTATGSTLDGSAGIQTIAAFDIDSVTVNLAVGTATVNGSSIGDTLIGISAAAASGSRDTLLAGNAAAILSSSGSANTLIAGSGDDFLLSSGTGDTLIGGSGSDVLSSSGEGNTLIAGTGADTLLSSGADDTLIGGIGSVILSSSGESNVLIAGSSAQTLVSSGFHDTLLGNAVGSTLVGAAGSGAIAAYSIDDVTVDLTNDMAAVNGSSAADTLVGIMVVAAMGSNDTLIGGAGTTLISDGSGNTLVAVSGQATAAYVADDVTVDLATGTAGSNGSALADTLVGIVAAAAFGSDDTLIAGSNAAILSSSGSSNTLIAGNGTDTLLSSGTGDTLIGEAGADVLSSSGQGNTLIAGSGVDTLLSSGAGDMLIGGAGADVLSSSGQGNTLVAASGSDTLSSIGQGDTLVGNADGGVLDGSLGSGTVAAYALDDVTVDLTTGTANVNGSSNRDALIGIDIAEAFGTGDTLIGGSGTTLIGNGGGNTLVGVSAGVAAGYLADDVTVDLATGIASLNGSAVSDTLLRIDAAAAFGSNDTLIAGGGVDTLISGGTGDVLLGGSGVDTLASSGMGNTLIGGGGLDTLSSSGFDDTLVGNADGSVLDGSLGSGTVAAYALDDVTVDLTAGMAGVNGSAVSDILIGITVAAAFGTGDTLIGGSGTTLISNGGGNRLVAVSAGVTAGYLADNVTVDLATDNASVNGSAMSDTLLGINAVAAFGSNDTLVAGSSVAILSSEGSSNTLIAGSGTDTLLSSGTGDALIGGGGADTLSSSGVDDTLVGNADGSVLDGSLGSGTVAAYALDDVTVDLTAGTAGMNGSTARDTLIGITTAEAFGTGDTLIGGSGTTLISNGGGNTLVAVSAGVTAAYLADDVTVDLATGMASVNSSVMSDTLIGTTAAQAFGIGDTLIGGGGNDILIDGGANGTLVAGVGATTLIDSGTNGTYQFGLADGQATIVNGSSLNTATSNELDFGAGTSDNQLWFLQSGNNLQIDVMGTQSKITIDNWFAGAGNQLEEITAGGLKIDSQIGQLVQAMATYSANNPGFDPTAAAQTPNDPTLQNTIAAAWHP